MGPAKLTDYFLRINKNNVNKSGPKVLRTCFLHCCVAISYSVAVCCTIASHQSCSCSSQYLCCIVFHCVALCYSVLQWHGCADSVLGSQSKLEWKNQVFYTDFFLMQKKYGVVYIHSCVRLTSVKISKCKTSHK